MKTIKNAEGIIRHCLEKAQEAGVEIVAGTFYGPQNSKCMCPIAAVHWRGGHEAPRWMDEVLVEVSYMLDVDPAWVSSFVCGFDGAPGGEGEAYELGVKLRKELQPRTLE